MTSRLLAVLCQLSYVGKVENRVSIPVLVVTNDTLYRLS